jgi:hypothetical protein
MNIKSKVNNSPHNSCNYKKDFTLVKINRRLDDSVYIALSREMEEYIPQNHKRPCGVLMV